MATTQRITRSTAETSSLKPPATRRKLALTLALMLALVIAPGITLAADPTKPHPHQGRIPAFQGEPPPVPLTDAERARLEAGESVMKQVQQDGGGRGVAVFRVAAPPDATWSVIRDFARYPEWVEGVDSTRIYKQEGDSIYVAFQISAMTFDYEYYIRHTYPAGKTWGTWTLDYTRKSDLDDSVGYWRVVPLKGNPDMSQVEYSVDIRISGWIPGFVKNMIVDKGLKQATVWVNEQAVKRYQKRLSAMR